VVRGPCAKLEGAVLGLVQRGANATDGGVVWVTPDTATTSVGNQRSQLAQIIDTAHRAAARAIVVASPLGVGSDSDDLQRLRRDAENSSDARLRAWVTELDHDGTLEAAIRSAGNVVLTGTPDQPPLTRFAAAARAVGTEPVAVADADGVSRVGRLYRSLPGQVPQVSVTFAAWTVTHAASNEIALKDDTSVANAAAGLRQTHGAWVPFYGPRARSEGGLQRLSVDDLRTQAAALRGKVVVIGGSEPTLNTPAASAVPFGDVVAQRIASLEADDYATVPRYARSLLALALVGSILWAVLVAPRQRAQVRIVATVLVALSLLLVEFGLLVVAKVWIPLGLAAVAILLTTIATALVPERAVKPAERVESAVPIPPRIQHPTRPSRSALGEKTSVPAADPFLSADVTGPLPLKSTRNIAATLETTTPAVPKGPLSLRQINAILEARAQEPTRAEVADMLLGRSKRPPKPRLGRYELDRELGRGAMGTVFLGRDPTINRVVAVKAIPIVEEFAEADLADVRARFFREAEMAGRLKHPSIVAVYDAGEDGGIAWIAMEYVEGRMLSEFAVKENLLPVAQVLEICARVAEALDFAHAQNVVHRDVKPANVLFDPETLDTRITDFGIARLTNASATRSGIVLGTPSFMAPERLEGRTFTGQSDQFSLGVAMYQLLCGELPFRSESMAGLMGKIINTPHTPLRTVRPDLPPCTAAIVDRALQKNPADRFKSTGEMGRFLRACILACTTN
jgi:Protein kinase domain/CHASE2 domain